MDSHEQRVKLEEVLTSSMSVIPTHWMNQWVAYTSCSSPGSCISPGAISNKTLVDVSGNPLPRLIEGVHFNVLPTTATDLLFSWYGGDKPLTTTQLAQNIGMPYTTSLSCNSFDSGNDTGKTFESSQITATEPPQIEKTPSAMQEIIPIPIKRTKQTRMPKSTVQETKFAEPNTIAKQAGWLEIALLPAGRASTTSTVFTSPEDTICHLKNQVCIQSGLTPDNHSLMAKKVFDPEIMWEALDSYGGECTLSEIGIDDCTVLKIGDFLPKTQEVASATQENKDSHAASCTSLLLSCPRLPPQPYVK